MGPPSSHSVTGLLQSWSQGDQSALIPLVSKDLLRIAKRYFALCAQLMRRILVDHARARGRGKRGGGACPVALDEALPVTGERSAAPVALDDALQAPAVIDPRKSKVVEMRFFGGLEVQGIAEVLQVSPDTVKRDWRLAKLWLAREIRREKKNGS